MDDWNGCGLSWLWGLPEEDPRSAVCARHDEAFEKGGSLKDWHQSNVDLLKGWNDLTSSEWQRTKNTALVVGVAIPIGGLIWLGREIRRAFR